jgi:threonine/homoserine/homoserine lactone efflux protein
MIHHFWLFALASFLLNITPGNDMLYVASRSTGQGVRAGVVSALGVMAGCFVHVAAIPTAVHRYPRNACPGIDPVAGSMV